MKYFPSLWKDTLKRSSALTISFKTTEGSLVVLHETEKGPLYTFISSGVSVGFETLLFCKISDSLNEEEFCS